MGDDRKGKNMSDKTVNQEAEAVDNTPYAPTETRALTPEEAAREVLTPPASQADQRGTVAVAESVPFGDVKERYFEGDTIVEVVNVTEADDTEVTKLPIAVNAEEDYQAKIAATDVDYTATREDEELDVTK